MDPDFSVNGYAFDLGSDEFSLESILSEYKDFDPDAPAPAPKSAAAFESRPVQAELIDEPDPQPEPPGVLEQALAAEEPLGPEPRPERAPEQPDPFASYAEDFPEQEPDAPTPPPKRERRTWRDSLGLPPEPEETPEDDAPDDDVREYRPHTRAARPQRPAQRSAAADSVRKRFAGLRSWVDRMTAEYEDEPPVEPEDFAPPDPDTPIRPDPPRPVSEPDEPTMVFHAVADDPQDAYAPRSSDEYAAEAAEAEPEPERLDFRETVIQPIVTRLAAVAYRMRESQARARENAAAEEPLGPEPSPERAAKYYGTRIRSLRLRGRISAIVTVMLLYIALGLPVTGLLRSSPTVLSLTCLVLLFTVMLAGLDVLVTGALSLVRRRPGLETMVALSALFSTADAVVCAITGSTEYGLPFCGVSALAITFCLYSALFTCQGYRTTFRVLQKADDPYTLFSDSNVSKEGITLMKSRRETEGFIHRAEESSPCEALYSVLSPYLIAAGLILGVLAAVLSGVPGSIAHVLAAIFAAFVPLSAIFSFSLPFRTVARRLYPRGLALAGWSGVSDIGRSVHMIVTDDDLFPPKTVAIGDIRILEGAYPQKVISCAASVVIASGSCLAPVFAQLLEKHHCRLIPVTQFSCGKTGGLTAMVDGEEVLVGGADFVNLRGIRLPEKLSKQETLFVVISGQLVGIIPIRYTPVKSVQNALIELLRSRQEASFAVRDSNITPVMLHQKFKISTDGFHFPSYAKRYALSAAEPSDETHIAGVMARSGLGSLVRISSLGKRLYGIVRATVALSLVGVLVGVLAMFLLCAMGAFDAATAANLLLFQLLWLIPPMVLNFGLRR